MKQCFYLLVAAVVMSAGASADSIRVGGEVYRDVYIRDTAGFYIVYHPETGRMDRVSKRRSTVSDVNISSDDAYRERLLAQYNANKSAPKSDSVPPKKQAAAPASSSIATPASRDVTPRLDGDLLKQREQMKDLAIFESQLEHWKLLPDDVRERIQEGLHETLAQRTARRAADRQRALTQVQELGDTKVAVQQQLSSVAYARDAAVQEAKLEDSSDFYFDAYESTRGYVPWYQFYYDEDDRLRSIPTWWYTEDTSLKNAAFRERARTRGKISAADRAYAEQAAAYGKQLNSVERAMSQQERAARAALSKSIDEQYRFGGQQMRVAALTEAAETDYRPQLRAVPVGTWKGVAPQRLPEFTVGQGLWRLDCTLENGKAPDKFAVVLHDAKTGQAFTRLSSADFLGMRTRVFDEPGTYYVTVEQGLVQVPYQIEVSALIAR